jgi:predicted amidohydrolase YtcJ
LKLTGRTIVSARAAAVPATILFDSRIQAILPPAPGLPASAFILPGLIDSHTHPLETGLEELFANLAGAACVADVQQRLREHREDTRRHGMMLGFNLEPGRLREQRYPRRDELDAAIPELPVFIYRVDGHSAVTNTAGLQLLEKVPGTGNQVPGTAEAESGVLRGAAYEKASRLFKHRLAPDTVREALRRAGAKAAAGGVTTIGALVGVEDTTAEEWQVLIEGLGPMDVSAVPYLQTWDVDVPRRFGLKQAGGCLLIDGSFGSHTAALSRDYSDAPGMNGSAYVSDERLIAFLRAAFDAGLQTAVHAIGDRAVEQVVQGTGPGVQGSTGSGSRPGPQDPGTPGPSAKRNPLRHRIEHAELLNADLVERIARLGLVLGVQPAFETEWGGPDRMYAQRLGERWRCTNPYRRLLASGVRLAGGSDAPITPIDPVSGIRAAVERPNPNEAINGEQALAMFTSEAAFALNRETSCGGIEVGKQADFTLLTQDPRTTADCRVVATIRGGRCTYRNEALNEYSGLEE